MEKYPNTWTAHAPVMFNDCNAMSVCVLRVGTL